MPNGRQGARRGPPCPMTSIGSTKSTGGELCGTPPHIRPSAGFNHFYLAACSVARGRRFPCLSNVRRRGALVRRIGNTKPGRHILVVVARYLAAHSSRSAAGTKRPTSRPGYQEGTSSIRTCRRRVHDDVSTEPRTGHCSKKFWQPNNPPATRSGEAFALTEIPINLAILSAESTTTYPSSQDGNLRVLARASE